MVRLALAVAIILCCASQAAGQSGMPNGEVADHQASSATDDEHDAGWSFSIAAYTYVLPDEGNYVQPTVATDRAWLHLEARYNYEDRDTGSAWLGYNFAGGQKVEWTLTPMFGGVFGNTKGVAPGYKAGLDWRKLGVWSEGEYVFDAGDSTDSFFYNWSEVTVSPAAWWRAGLVTQRTRVYASDRDIQRGLLVGFTYRSLDSVVYVLNPDDTKPIVVLAVTVGF